MSLLICRASRTKRPLRGVEIPVGLDEQSPPPPLLKFVEDGVGLSFALPVACITLKDDNVEHKFWQ